MSTRTLAAALVIGAIITLLVALTTMLAGNIGPEAEQAIQWPTEDGRYLREYRTDSGQWRISYAIVRAGKVSVERGLIEGQDGISKPVKSFVGAISPINTRLVKADRCGKVIFYPVGAETHGLQKGAFPATAECTIRDASGKWTLLKG